MAAQFSRVFNLRAFGVPDPQRPVCRARGHELTGRIPCYRPDPEMGCQIFSSARALIADHVQRAAEQ